MPSGKYGSISWSIHGVPKGSAFKQTLRARVRNREVTIPLLDPWALMSDEQRIHTLEAVKASLCPREPR